MTHSLTVDITITQCIGIVLIAMGLRRRDLRLVLTGAALLLACLGVHVALP